MAKRKTVPYRLRFPHLHTYWLYHFTGETYLSIQPRRSRDGLTRDLVFRPFGRDRLHPECP